MIGKKELLDQGKLNNFTMQQSEIDYLQHIVLSVLYRNPVKGLVFKGGTALQKAYGLKRFSEDLDFDADKDITHFIEKAIKEVGNYYDIDYKYTENNLSSTFNLKIKGPLFDGSDLSIETIRIELSMRERPLLEPEKIFINPLYNDIGTYELIVMQKEEMLAEKIRALLYGNHARDVYDLWFLLKKGTKVDKSLINKKLELYSKDRKLPDFDIAEEIEKERKKWELEMSILTKTLPTFEEAKETILNALS